MGKIKFLLSTILTVILLLLCATESISATPFVRLIEAGIVLFGLSLFVISLVKYRTIGQPLLFILALVFILNGLVLQYSMLFIPYIILAIINCIISYPSAKLRRKSNYHSTIIESDEKQNQSSPISENITPKKKKKTLQ